MYKAVVAKIHTKPIPGCDNIVLGTCLGYQVIVSNQTIDGELGVFFEQDGQISEEFATVNDIVRRKNEDGTPAGAFFETNRRVRAIKMRGVKSEGYWCPLAHFAYTGFPLESLSEGDQFDELNGHPICNKYFTPNTRSAQGKSAPRADNLMFKKHVDTEQFKRAVHLIPEDSIIYITEKLHGTSFRYGNVQVRTPVVHSLFKRLVARLFGLKLQKEVVTWEHINGTRNVVIKDVDNHEGFYGKGERFRFDATRGIELHKGEVIYGELVGFTETGKPIMEPQDTSKLKDKSLSAKYGQSMLYSYGNHCGDIFVPECTPYIYRITQVNEDGYAVELSWRQVVKRCEELGLKTVPSLSTLSYQRLIAASAQINTDVDSVFSDYVNAFTEKSNGTPVESALDSSHIREGVVIRYESSQGVGFLKNKSFAFGVLEGYLKEDDNYVDREEAA